MTSVQKEKLKDARLKRTEMIKAICLANIDSLMAMQEIFEVLLDFVLNADADDEDAILVTERLLRSYPRQTIEKFIERTENLENENRGGRRDLKSVGRMVNESEDNEKTS